MKKFLISLAISGMFLLSTGNVHALRDFQCGQQNLEQLVGKTILVKVLETIGDEMIICMGGKGKALKLKLSGVDIPGSIFDEETTLKSEVCKSPGLTYLGQKARDVVSYLLRGKRLVVKVKEYDKTENAIVGEAKPVRVNTAYMKKDETINEFLVRRGFACGKEGRYSELMKEARRKRLGLWGTNLRAMDCFCSTEQVAELFRR